MSTVTWSQYIFTVYTSGDEIPYGGGVYIFAGKGHSENWKAYYVGQSGNLRERLAGHERWEEAVRLGATHIHIRLTSTERDRLIIEKKIIDDYNPPLND